MLKGKIVFLSLIVSTVLCWQAIPGSVDTTNAQVPYVQVSFDDYGGVYTEDCPPEVVVDTLSVYAFNFNMLMQKIQYRIIFPPTLSFLGDIFDERVRTVGNSEFGIEIEFLDIGDASGPFRVQRLEVLWQCTDCSGWLDSPIEVTPRPNSGELNAVRWPDLVVVDGVGMISTTCPGTLPVETTTWGQVKSLYN